MKEHELYKRLENLERDNRRLKRLGTIVLIVAASFGAIYATRPVPDVIKAHEFDVVDDAGRVHIRLSTTPRGSISSVRVLDAQGNRAASMDVFPWASSISAGKDGGEVAQLIASPQSGSVSVEYSFSDATLSGKRGKALGEAEKARAARIKSEPSVGITNTRSGRPNITLRDAQGYSMDLGNTNAVTPATGEAQQTSAASIVMFGNGKKHRVIWQAP